jgi:hypothetical protein
MQTHNLNKTNLSAYILANYEAIETFLGKEIEQVITMKKGFENKSYWQKGVLNRLASKCLNPFTMINKVFVDLDKEQIIVKGRNKWQRVESTKVFKVEKIGYKLQTTHISEGWLYGNPIEVTKLINHN